MALDCDEFDMIRIQIGNFITDSQIYRSGIENRIILINCLVINMLDKEDPFDAFGLFYVEKTTFMTIISSSIAYLVIMLQFN